MIQLNKTSSKKIYSNHLNKQANTNHRSVNELRSQIVQYHQSEHTYFKQSTIQINQSNPSREPPLKLSATSLTNTEFNQASGTLKTPSILTGLSAPHASFDCYQQSASASLNDLNNKQMANSNESIGKASSSIGMVSNSKFGSSTNARQYSEPFDIEKLLTDCSICERYAKTLLNKSHFVMPNHLKN